MIHGDIHTGLFRQAVNLCSAQGRWARACSFAAGHVQRAAKICEGLKVNDLAVAKPVSGHRGPGQPIGGPPYLGSLEMVYIRGNIVFRCVLAYSAAIQLVPEREQVNRKVLVAGRAGILICIEPVEII